ncbi:MAG: transporter substrate-binding domain-containing protein [Alphaproteobacteria bacterium]|nr:transporter substrate-binding domain-containing protein [Alphaproteobacteria bacterium]
MKNLLLVIVAVALALFIQNFVLHKETQNTAKTETAYERVMRTGTLRCAYALYPPFFDKDPNTGKLSGVSYDIMTAFEQVSGLKIEWGPEIDWGDIAATLQSGKADAFCTNTFATPQRGRVLAFSTPLSFSTIEAYARDGDTRFDNDRERINQPDIRIAVNMGDMSEEVARRLFPKAQLVYKGATGGEAELFLNVISQKADLTLSGPSNLTSFNASNPANVLRKIEFSRPLMTFSASLAVEIHEIELLNLINASSNNLIDSGTIDQILRNDLGKDYDAAYFPPPSRLR